MVNIIYMYQESARGEHDTHNHGERGEKIGADAAADAAADAGGNQLDKLCTHGTTAFNNLNLSIIQQGLLSPNNLNGE